MRYITLVDIWRRHADDYHVQGASKVSWTGARTIGVPVSLLGQTITMYALHEMYMMIYEPSGYLTMRSITLVDIWRRLADDHHVQGASKVKKPQ